MERKTYDIAIIGGGPAGLTAALYAARGGASTVLFESVFAGGQIVKTEHLDNFPGFPEGIDGFGFAALLEKQTERYGTEIVFSEITELQLSGAVKRIVSANGIAEAKAVILCTGASPRLLGVPGEAEFTGRGVSYCATCDGMFFRGKKTVVVGGGDTAVADALYLAGIAESVALIHRRDELRAAGVLANAAKENEKISFVWDSVPEEIVGEQMVSGIRIRNVKTGERSLIETAAVFAAIGVDPVTALFLDQVELDGSGAVKTDREMRTSVPGVFAAGDVRDTPLRQVVTACADGAVAASGALAYLRQ